MQAAKEFYLDYGGYPYGRLARLPFWRYLLHYSAVGVDETAGRAEGIEPDEREQRFAQSSGSAFPFLATLAARSYRYATTPTTAAVAARTTPTAGQRLAKSRSTSEIGVQTDAIQEAVHVPSRVPSPEYTPYALPAFVLLWLADLRGPASPVSTIRNPAEQLLLYLPYPSPSLRRLRIPHQRQKKCPSPSRDRRHHLLRSGHSPRIPIAVKSQQKHLSPLRPQLLLCSTRPVQIARQIWVPNLL